MKLLIESIFDVIDSADVKPNKLSEDEIKDAIESFLKDNCNILGQIKIQNKDKDDLYIVDVHGSVQYINKKRQDLTGGLFKFGEVSGTFSCIQCKNLESLKGAPRKCAMFKCSGCAKLKSLEYAPNCVNILCDDCKNLESLKGVPQVCWTFNCSGCTKLKNLKGAPVKCMDFNCSNCTSLKNLDDAPDCAVFTCYNIGCKLKTKEIEKKVKAKEYYLTPSLKDVLGY